MKNLISNKEFLLKIYFFLAILEGIVVLFLTLTTPSMERNSLVWGYSAPRLGLAFCILLFTILLLFLTLLINSQSHFSRKITTNISNYLEQDNNLLILLALLFLVMATGLMFLFLIPALQPFFSSLLSPKFDKAISTLLAIIKNATPLIVWAIALCLQTCVTLYYFFHNKIRRKISANPGIFHQIALIVVISVSAVFHWIILAYNLYVFVAIPHWFWKFYEKPSRHDWLFPLLCLFSFLIFRIILSHSQHKLRNIIMLICLGYFLMVGFGWIEGQGHETLRQLFITKGHWGYARFACTNPNLLQTLRDYESVAQLDPFFKTKPPGIFAFYIFIQKSINLVMPASTIDACYFNLTTFMAYAFPMLAFIVLINMHKFNESLNGRVNANLPGILFVTLPAVILTPLFLDQELYPLLFMTGMLLSQKTLANKSPFWAFISGVWFYLSIYFNFSLLPLLPLMLIWLALSYWQTRKSWPLSRAAYCIIAIVAGIFVAGLLFKIAFNYDFFLRYTHAMTSHRLHKEFSTGLSDIMNAILVNNVEFFTWIGMPVSILFFVRLFKSGMAYLHNRAGQMDALMAAFFVTYTALNLLGQTHGEVARLWIFLMPMVCVFSADEIGSIFKKQSKGVYYITLLQLITMFIIFKFQDLD